MAIDTAPTAPQKGTTVRSKHDRSLFAPDLRTTVRAISMRGLNLVAPGLLAKQIVDRWGMPPPTPHAGPAALPHRFYVDTPRTGSRRGTKERGRRSSSRMAGAETRATSIR